MLLTFDQLCKKYLIPPKHFFKYLQLKNYLSSKLQRIAELPPLTKIEEACIKNTKGKGFLSIYYNLLMLSSKDSAIQEDIDENDWNQACLKAQKQTINTCFKLLQYKWLMRTYITPVKLHHMSNDIPDICTKCLVEKGTLLHCLWECPKIQDFWKDVIKYLSEVFKVKIPLKGKLYVLGIYPREFKQSGKKLNYWTMDYFKPEEPLRYVGRANRVVALEAKVDALSAQVVRLADKADDLESRQRRDNCRLIGVEEGFGNIRPEKAVAELLKEALALDYTPTLDRAHRSLQPRPKDGNAPRPIIVKFHYFQEKVDVLRKAMGAGPITRNGKRFYIYPDYSATVRKKRSAFTEVRRLLRRCTGVKYGLLYPATLKITTPAGEQMSFEDPIKARHYVETNLRPRETEGE
uniref:Reverse transcriptase zinc-binding domain-containing protein n=1 Tax=Haplochromis burtoni TaxID=8153 RepID=A0A3Q3BY06_HAPBU